MRISFVLPGGAALALAVAAMPPAALAQCYATFITANGGPASSVFTALVAGLDAGRAYLNIHSSFAPGGEIRGFLSPVPEPESYALLLSGLAVVGWVARRQKRAA